MKELFAKVSQPGEDGKPTFRIEIGRNDGTELNPKEALWFVIKVLEDVARKCDFEEPKAVLHAAIDSDYKIEQIEIS